MNKLFIITAFTITFTFISSLAFSSINVVSVRGDVAYKSGRQWKPLTKGQELTEGTKISTGVRSSALINIDNNKLYIRQLTMMKIFRNKVTKKRRDTNIGLKYGSLNARIKRIARLKTSFKITTPVATSSVRGTEELVSYGPKSGMIIKVIEGQVNGETPNGVNNIIYGRYLFRLKSDKSRPENLLSDVRDRSIVKLHDENIMDEEKYFNEYWSDEIVDNSEGSVSYIDSKTGYVPNVDISFEWQGE